MSTQCTFSTRARVDLLHNIMLRTNNNVCICPRKYMYALFHLLQVLLQILLINLLRFWDSEGSRRRQIAEKKHRLRPDWHLGKRRGLWEKQRCSACLMQRQFLPTWPAISSPDRQGVYVHDLLSRSPVCHKNSCGSLTKQMENSEIQHSPREPWLAIQYLFEM